MPLPVTDSLPRTLSRGRGPLNVAHRGASHDVVENTLAAIRRAVDHGADLVEVDVQRSRDGALVLMHDTTLARTTDARRVFPGRAPWRVADFTYDELSRLDAGAWTPAGPARERVPTLDDALELLGQSGTGLLLELKAPELYPGIVSDVVSSLRAQVARARAGQVVVQSFSFAAMKEHKTRAPEIPVGLLGTPARSSLPALATWADQVNPSHWSVDGAYVDLVHGLGLECFVWTVNRAAAMRRALRMGVDGVITNRPDRFGRLLDQAASSAGASPSTVGPRV